jgi:hypothetical protein
MSAAHATSTRPAGPRSLARLRHGLVAILAILAIPLTPSVPAQVIITEFMASNGDTLADDDGEFSDWIELHNPGGTTVSLDGWTLTDTDSQTSKWRLPAVNLPPQGFLVVFASGKDRRDPGHPLHANFNLGAGGEYLALFPPGSSTPTSEFAPAFPEQFRDLSYGLGQQVTTNTFLNAPAPGRLLLPSNNSLGTSWTQPDFNDTSWTTVTTGVGYETETPGFAVRNVKASIFVNHLNDADAVLANPALQVGVVSETAQVLNYYNTGGTGNYENNRPFPGQNFDIDVEDFVVEATATLTLPAAGTWTFGVNSDDGFRLVIGTFEMAYPDPRGPSDSLATFNAPAAGDYPLRLVYYERGGGAGLEFFAAQGSQNAWSPVFRLVGDSANGGLAVRSTPLSGGGGGGSLRDLIASDIEASMRNQHASAYLRIPFQIPQPDLLQSLNLRLHYNDGFVAYLNGHEVARRLAPENLNAQSTATASRSPDLALVPERIPLSAHLHQLLPGNNVLAIHGLNAAVNDPRFLLRPTLGEDRIQSSSLLYFTQPTPGSPNGNGFLGFADRPRFSVSRGFHDAPFNLEIQTTTPGATIFYTTNGTPPAPTNGIAYSAPLPIASTTTLRAAAFRDQYEPSPVETHSYLFPDDIIRQSANGAPPPGWPASWGNNVVDYGMDPDVVNNPLYAPTIRQDLQSLPAFSIVMDVRDLFHPGTGIYANPGQDGRSWERPCSVELIHPDGTEGFQSGAGIRIRGGFSRSTDNPKHAFRLFFRQEYGAGKLNHPLFGDQGTDRFDNIDLRTFQNYSWSFQGDSSGIFIRDQLNRDLQLAMGHQGERGEFYHLYINGQYWGLFNTCERPEASYGETYFGGAAEDYDVIKVEAGPYAINATDGNLEAWTRLYNLARTGFTTTAAYQFIQGNNPDGSPNPDYEVLVDLPNLIDYMLIILYGGNLDAPISNFLGNERPNNFYGLRNRNPAARQGFQFFVHDAEHTLLNVNQNRVGPFPAGSTSVTYSNPQYFWQRLQAHPDFRILVADHVHRHFFNNGLLTAARARALFDQRIQQIDRAVVGESARWGDAKRSTPYTRATWLSAVNSVRNSYLPNRSTTVLNQLRTAGLYPATVAPSFSPHGGPFQPGTPIPISAPAGTIYYTTDGSDPRLPGGAISPTAQVYSGPLDLAESTTLRSRARNGSTWSALNEAPFTAIQTFSELWISEIMYHPADSETYNDTQLEFVELKNVSSSELDLSGVQFTEGISFTFPLGTRLAPGAFVVLVSDPAAFAATYPGVPIDGTYTGQLANSGERLTLSHAVGTTLFSVDYSDSEPWPLSADGGGFSLVPVNPGLMPDPDDASLWRASQAIGGSPGQDDPPTNVPVVLVNELLAHTDPGTPDAVELHNPNAVPVDVGHWFLTDRRDTPAKYRIPSPTVIPAGGFVVFNETQFNPNPGAPGSFTFSSHGEEVFLYSADATGNLTGYSHGFSFPASANGESFGRHVISTGETQYPPMSTLSLGATNPLPRVGPVVFSEIHFLPQPGEAEFVEIQNNSDSPVPLYHPEFPDLTWRLNGIGFTFPTNLALPPQGLLVVTAGDPATFRNRYGIPLSVPVLGPFPGNLQDDGERLQLLQPDSPDTNEIGTVIIPEILVDQVQFRTRAPWPTGMAGLSLERTDLHQHGDDPARWRLSPGSPSPGLPNTGNRPPQTDAGSDRTIQAASFPTPVTLAGSATDDGLPESPGQLSYQWSQIDGPGSVWFSDPSLTNAIVHLPGVGTYTLRLTASDTALQASDDVILTVSRPAAAVTAVAQGATWRYWDRGSDLPNSWTQLDFDDAAWPSGPAKLGYGDGDEGTVVSFGPNAANKYVTTFFRHHFSLSQAAAFTDLKVGLRRDDGAIVYLNGTEVFRSNMPEGPITFATFASNVVGGADETNFYEQSLDPSLLREGDNVLAVRVHQVNGDSSDLGFDLYLSGTAFPIDAPPSVTTDPHQTITLPAPALLTGTVADDALPIPPGVLSVSWSLVSGPGPVAIALPTQPFSPVTFSTPGTYVFRLSAFDGARSSSAETTVQVLGDNTAYDTWKETYFTAAELLDPTISGDEADPDLDGHGNRQEFLAGTLPRDAASVLRLGTVRLLDLPTPSLELRFPTAPGRSYSLQARDPDPTAPWINLQQVPASENPGEQVITLPAPDSATRLFRVVTPQQPPSTNPDPALP